MFSKTQMSKAVLTVVLLALFLVNPREVFAQVVMQVVINEFLPAPSTGNSEWVEFYNSGSSTVDLSNYYFDDDPDINSDAGSSAKIAISGLLGAQSTCYWDLTTYLNNNGDVPSLLNVDGTVADSYSYTTTTTDKSYARVPDGGSWQSGQTSSKSSLSCLSLTPTPTPTPIPTAAPTPTPTATPPLTPTPLKTAIPSPTPKPTPTKSPAPSPTESPEPEITEIVLGAEKSPTPTPNPDDKTTIVEGWFTPGKILPFVFIIGGVGILAGVGFTFVRQRKMGYNGQDGSGNKKLEGNAEEST